MSNVKPFVSIIIPTFKDWKRLNLCLRAIKSQDYPKEKFEVIVVNNDPSESFPDEFLNFNFKLIYEARAGSYTARNTALKKSKGEIIVFTDSDCIPNSNWLFEGIKLMNLKYKNFIIAGNIEVFPKNINKPNIFELFSMHFELNQLKYVKKKRFATANVFIKKEVFLNLGFFNSKLKSGGDFEFASRATQNNYSILFCKESIVKHPARNTFDKIISKAKRKAGGLYDSKINLFKIFLSIMNITFMSIFDILFSNYSLFNKSKLFILIIIYNYFKLYEYLKLSITSSKSQRR